MQCQYFAIIEIIGAARKGLIFEPICEKNGSRVT